MDHKARALMACATLALIGACGRMDPVSSQEAPDTAQSVNGNTPGDANTTAADANTPALNTPVVGGHALVLSGSGFTSDVGHAVNAALLDGNTVQAMQTTTVDAQGAFTLTFAAAVTSGKTYKVSYYADRNKNGFCNAPPTDAGWTAPVPAVTGDTTVKVAYSGTFMAVCGAFGKYNLTFTGTAFTPHEGKPMYIGVADQKDNSLVGEIQMAIITGGDVKFAWPGVLVPGHAYTLAYFADLNKNMTCDPPNTDHQWFQKIPAVTADVAAAGKHADPQASMCTYLPTGKLP